MSATSVTTCSQGNPWIFRLLDGNKFPSAGGRWDVFLTPLVFDSLLNPNPLLAGTEAVVCRECRGALPEVHDAPCRCPYVESEKGNTAKPMKAGGVETEFGTPETKF